jgi:hypothetical protein
MKYFFLLLFFFAACKKEEASCELCDKAGALLEAQVIDAGLVTADGCGWVLRVGSSDLHPKNLPDSMKISQLPVTVSFKLTEQEFPCGILGRGGLPVVEITSIKRR